MDEQKSKKYPRTPHLSFSLGATSDDRILSNVDHFIGQQVVVTEKADGECTTMTSNHIHARSATNTLYHVHPSRSRMMTLWSTVRYDLPERWRFIGENVQQEYLHSIKYENLVEPYFLLFAVVNSENEYLSWTETEFWAKLLDLQLVPVLYSGMWDEEKIKACQTGVSAFGGAQEGYVVRYSTRFQESDFSQRVAKFVRANHVATDAKYWRRNYVIQKGDNDEL